MKKEDESILIGDIEQETRTKKDELFAKLFGNKENSQPNFTTIDKPGRYSLQPQPLGAIKIQDNTIAPVTVVVEQPEKPVI